MKPSNIVNLLHKTKTLDGVYNALNKASVQSSKTSVSTLEEYASSLEKEVPNHLVNLLKTIARVEEKNDLVSAGNLRNLLDQMIKRENNNNDQTRKN